MSVAAETNVQVEDVEYLRHASGPLLARLYRPKAPRTALVSLHGGRWTRESRLTNAVIDQALAEDGALVMALDIRMPPAARYPECVADINFAVRWLKQYAQSAGLQVANVGGIGTSSGGHQIMLSAMRPRDPRYAALPGPDGFDATLDYVIACWPVLDPLARYKMAKAKGMDDHVAAHHAYWHDESAQAEGNPQMMLDRGERVELPPVLVIQGTGDAILPTDMADNFAAAYRKAGGSNELRKFDGQPHTFITKEPAAAASREAIEAIKAFVRARTGRA
jgi:acetyl esterase/lipase